MNHLSSRLLICVGVLALGGCAGKGERIDIAIPGGTPGGGTVSLATPGPRIAVLSFRRPAAQSDPSRNTIAPLGRNQLF